MDLDKIKALMAAMKEQNITKLAFKGKKGFELSLERNPKKTTSEPCSLSPKPSESHIPVSARLDHTEKQPAKDTKEEIKESAQHHITSPMVGTFYTSPTPEAPPFIKVGDIINEDTVVCIIEAMKVLNEVKAGKKGKVKSILIENAHPVEFGTKLFSLEEI